MPTAPVPHEESSCRPRVATAWWLLCCWAVKQHAVDASHSQVNGKTQEFSFLSPPKVSDWSGRSMNHVLMTWILYHGLPMRTHDGMQGRGGAAPAATCGAAKESMVLCLVPCSPSSARRSGVMHPPLTVLVYRQQAFLAPDPPINQVMCTISIALPLCAGRVRVSPQVPGVPGHWVSSRDPVQWWV
jgi:hypothetical protein